MLSMISDAGPCSSNPCQNSAPCSDDGPTITCSCVAGYQGTDCALGWYNCLYD